MDLSNENVVHIKKDGFEYLQFRRLLKYSDIISHAYCLGLDRNFRTGRANGEKISENEYLKAISDYKGFCKCVNLDYKNIVKTNQSHTDNIEIIKKKINVNAPDLDIYQKTDGLITDKKNLVLSTTNADCILLILFDPVKKVIANVHSGWRGTLKKISLKAVEKMQKEYNCKAEDIICCMCPSIRKCHFEVNREVYELFYNEFKNLKQLCDIIESDSNKDKWYIDTIAINRVILENAGLLENNIIDSKLCSVCNKEYMHSFRVEKEDYGLSTAIVSLI